MSFSVYERRLRPVGSLNVGPRDRGRLFESDPNNRRNAETVDWIPRANLRKSQSDYVAQLDLPGVSADQIDLVMKDRILSISGRRSAPESKGHTRVECPNGSFRRSFSLPDAGDSGKISATSGNGVLTVIVPKNERPASRKITIDAH